MPARHITAMAIAGVLALPLLSAPVANAASPALVAAASQSCNRPGPWVIATKAVTIRAKATTDSTARGILYKGHKFTVHKTSKNWHYITDRTTGVKGWVSGAYVYRDVRMCLN
ncbi:SH3 domain-containing protein [Streptomyces sp. NPDC088789]|uniref:SH3 domain-containing protein n=1 Tax=Streptomyces sp. NPDC088789 TaxID=3365899 RepID=UPI00382A9DAE